MTNREKIRAGSSGDIKSLHDELSSAFDNDAIENGESVTPENSAESEATQKARKKLPAPGITLSAAFGSILANVLGLAMPLVILQVYDRIIPNQALPTFTLLILGLLVALVFEAITRTARAWLIGWDAAKYEAQVAELNMKRLLEAPASAVELRKPSDHLFGLNAVDILRQFYGGQSRLFLIDLPFVLLFVGLIWVIAGPLVFVPLFLFGAFGALTVRHGAVLRGLLAKRNEYDIDRHGFATQALTYLGSIKAQVGEALFHRTHGRFSRHGSVLNYETVVHGAEAHSLSAVFSNAAIAAVVSLGAYHVISGQLSVGALAAVTLLTGRAMQPLVRALGLWSQIQSLQIAKEQIAELHSLPAALPDNQSQGPIELKGKIGFKSVYLAKSENDQWRLDNVSFSIPAGNFSVVRAQSGAGATELAELLAGETLASQGSVSFDKIEFTSEQASALRNQIAYASNAPSVFDGTIMENITLFRKGAALDRAIEAAQLIGLDEQINQLPGGYATQMMSGVSSHLPAGLVQMVMLARAIARQAKILVLHDPLQRLDRKRQLSVLNGLATLKGKVTIVVFSHQPAFLKLADQVFDLNRGKIRKAKNEAAKGPATPKVSVKVPARAANG